jgi:hypothetical protein
MNPEQTENALKFYDEHFECIATAMLTPGQKQVLGDPKNKKCRFCGKAEPEVSFRKEAHAIPESLGNKSLATNYECDDCNQAFGAGIEDSFGKWSKPMRMMARIRGKNGVPTIKKGSQGGWRIDYKNDTFAISQIEGEDPVLEVDEGQKTITFKLPREPYIPVAVLKAFVKMALTIMPEEELPNFKTALSWICEKDHTKGFLPSGAYPVLGTFVPGPMPNDKIALFLYRRRGEVSAAPYAFFVLGYGNEAFQVLIPSPERDPVGISVTMPAFPNPRDIAPSEHGQAKVRPIDLTGRDVVKGEVVTVQSQYETQIPNTSVSPNQ